MIKLERSRRGGFCEGRKLDNFQWREYDAVGTTDPLNRVHARLRAGGGRGRLKNQGR
jgi:hypothetical protein